MKVSVVVLTYNHEKYLEKAIQSILNQDVDFEYEVLIGNDKSPDNTE
ncbi:MAG: glycosyltransferase family 2 protein, partial [Peptostreptococcaceae bacterium]